MIDLHLHSQCSDGTLSPSQIFRSVSDMGLYAFSLTDHDTTAGIPLIEKEMKNSRIHFIPGIEISCNAPCHEIHMLGYGIRWNDETLCDSLKRIRGDRRKRNLDMIQRFRNDRIPLTLEKLQHGNKHTVITRAHFARVLIEEGYCSTKQAAFKRFLGENCKYYLPKPTFPMENAIKLIRDAGGLPVLAHPFLYKLSDVVLEDLIRTLKSIGLAGLEVYHSSSHIGQIKKLQFWAKKYNLLETGGSDFHGSNKPDISIGTGHGTMHVDNHCFDDLIHALNTMP